MDFSCKQEIWANQPPVGRLHASNAHRINSSGTQNWGTVRVRVRGHCGWTQSCERLCENEWHPRDQRRSGYHSVQSPPSQTLLPGFRELMGPPRRCGRFWEQRLNFTGHHGDGSVERPVQRRAGRGHGLAAHGRLWPQDGEDGAERPGNATTVHLHRQSQLPAGYGRSGLHRRHGYRLQPPGQARLRPCREDPRPVGVQIHHPFGGYDGSAREIFFCSNIERGRGRAFRRRGGWCCRRPLSVWFRGTRIPWCS
jgi:hypothetical protein